MTEEQKKEIEDSYNYYWELYLKQQEEDADKKLYLGKLSGMDEMLSCLGYSFKPKEEKIESHITYQSYELVEIKK